MFYVYSPVGIDLQGLWVGYVALLLFFVLVIFAAVIRSLLRTRKNKKDRAEFEARARELIRVWNRLGKG